MLVQCAQDPQPVGSSQYHEERHQHPGEDQREPRLGWIAHERRTGKQQHHRKARGGEDRGHIVERAGGAWQTVQTAQPQNGGEHHGQRELQRQIDLVLHVVPRIQGEQQPETVTGEPCQVERQVHEGDIERHQDDALEEMVRRVGEETSFCRGFG